MPPLPEAIRLILAPLAPLFSARVWRQAQVLLLGAMLTPGTRTVTAALEAMGWAAARRFTHAHRVLNRATWSARQGSQMLLGADDTVERRTGRKINAKGCARDAVRSPKKPVIRCFGLKWVSMRLLVSVPWSRRVWALPFLTVLCWPAQKGGRRHKTSSDWVRHMMKPVRRWLPGQRLVLVVDGGFAAVALARAGVTQQVTRVARLRSIGSAVNSAVEVSKPIVQAGLIRLPGHAILPGGGMPLQHLEAVPEQIDREMVE